MVAYAQPIDHATGRPKAQKSNAHPCMTRANRRGATSPYPPTVEDKEMPRWPRLANAI